MLNSTTQDDHVYDLLRDYNRTAAEQVAVSMDESSLFEYKAILSEANIFSNIQLSMEIVVAKYEADI